MSARQIAVLISCSHDAVNRALERFGIGKAEPKTGPLPYGWKLRHGKRVSNFRQQKILTKMIEQRDRGLSFKQIADFLNENRISAPSGNSWHSCTVQRILERR